MSWIDKITQYIDRNFYPFIITVLAHIAVIVSFFLMKLDIEPRTKYEVVMELDPGMLEDLLEEMEEQNEQVNEMLAQGGSEMLSNQASAEGFTGNNASSTSGGSGQSAATGSNYGVSPENVPPETRTFDWQHDNQTERDTYDPAFPVGENTVYVGESTTEYNVANRTRFTVFEPKPHYMCPEGGIVHIDITVNKHGKVTKAEVNEAKTSATSECVISAALGFAKEFVFTEGSQTDSGYIQFTMQRQ